MNALTKNLAELGTKIQTGAAEFAEKHELEKKVQPLKQKAEALTAKAGEAIAGATKGKDKQPNEEGGESSGENIPTEEGAAARSVGEETPSKRNSVRESISGFTAKLKPKLEEVSIADIYLKAKSKVFGANSSEAAATGAEGAEPAVRTQSFEEMKEDVDDLSAKMEDTGKNNSNKKEVQKLLIPLFSKLKVAQDKFAEMIEARKKKKEEASAEGAEGGEESPNSPKKLLNTAETAVKKAFENAEKIARKVATKAGILDEGKDTEATNTEEAAETTPSTEEAAETSPSTDEAVETKPAAEPETEPVAEEKKVDSVWFAPYIEHFLHPYEHSIQLWQFVQ